ncbi:hypothetical protein FACS1894191_3290 [Clostridia bacterium]|nr:hypothetical protein FACS1894191_3290 [Clostridia bacterium]
MTELSLGVIEPFGSPVWGSNLAVFSNISGDFIPEPEAKEYISRACRYAKHYSVYLVPERFMLLGYQCMCLISPGGKVLGAQKCIFWNARTRTGKRSTVLEVFSTEFGGVALCVDVDIYRPEISRVAADMGAQTLICSQQIAEGDYNSGMVVSGVWGAAQSNPLYAVSVTNEFNCVCAPRALTKHNDGFVVTPNLKIPMTAKLSIPELSGLTPRFCLNRRLYAVHRQELL